MDSLQEESSSVKEEVILQYGSIRGVTEIIKNPHFQQKRKQKQSAYALFKLPGNDLVYI